MVLILGLVLLPVLQGAGLRAHGSILLLVVLGVIFAIFLIRHRVHLAFASLVYPLAGAGIQIFPFLSAVF